MTSLNAFFTSNSTDKMLDFLKHVKYEHLIAGVSGGITSTIILHPLDLIKIRFAVNDGRAVTTPKYNGIANAFFTIYRQDGFKGLYRGVTPNIWGSGTSWGLYFLFYNTTKAWIQDGDAHVQLSPFAHMTAASQAGILTLLITNPIWVVKTRLCMQCSTSTLPKSKVYTGMLDALKKIYVTEGARGLYKGLLPGMFGVSHGAVQFVVYEEMKNQYNKHKGMPINRKLGTSEYLMFAALSKITAVATTYPYQVIRARLQSQHQEYNSALNCIKQTWKYEGWRGFYKGLGPNLLRVTPATMITFLTYENVSHFLINDKNKC